MSGGRAEPIIIAFVIFVLSVSCSLINAEPVYSDKFDDEFVGPFASWVNVKTECGAVGDGKADDASAIQKGLDIINPATAQRKVLYFPAGTYRITQTLNVPRSEHAQTIGMGIIGEDPATTVIKWDGVQDGRMFYYAPWFARMMRLTLDGCGKAKDAIFHGKPFATALGYTDMVFKDVQFGIEAGERDGIAECLVLRCTFIRCSKAGINIQNFNTLDWWIWYSYFKDCTIGVSSEYNGGGGHYHVYESFFENSAEADMTITHTAYFGIRNNTSLNSKAFFIAKRSPNWSDKENYGASMNIQGNHIYDPHDVTPIRIANAGTIVIMDNSIRSRAEVTNGPIIQQATPSGDADMMCIGNTFTAGNQYDVKGRLSILDDKVVARTAIKTEIPVLPATVPNLHRRVFEVPAGANAKSIQHIIDSAALLAGKKPVIHFAPGGYSIDKTLEFPSGSDIIVSGDGILNASELNWVGKDKLPIIIVHGPNHAIFRDIHINCAHVGWGVRVTNCDQPGGRVNLQETWLDCTQGGPPELYVDGLDQTDVSTMGSGLGKIISIGGKLAQKGKRKTTQVVCYGMGAGCKSSFELHNGGSILQRDAWYEGGYRTGVDLSGGKGTLTWDGGAIAIGTYPGRGDALPDSNSGKAAIGIDNFQGKVSFIGVGVTSVDSARPATVMVTGNKPDMNVLFLGCIFPPEVYMNKSLSAKVALYHCRKGIKDQGTVSVNYNNPIDTGFARDMLAQTRTARLKWFTPLKRNVTDVRFDRVVIRDAKRSLELLAKP